MKIVVALDSFKGSLAAVQACAVVTEAVRALMPEAEVAIKPMADGGEGTAEVLMASAGGQWVSRTVMGPLPQMRVEAGFVWLPESEDGGRTTEDRRQGPSRSAPPRTSDDARGATDAARAHEPNLRRAGALVEMAAASGLPLLRPEQRNPLQTTTYGTGELIRAAVDYGARHILLAIGGSATVDGGVGAAMALGWRFLTKDGQEIGLGGGQLSQIATIVPPAHDAPARVSLRGASVPARHKNVVRGCTTYEETPCGVTTNTPVDLSALSVEVLCDVDNPLTGEHGAARVYGPQKGATPEMVEELEAGLTHLAQVVRAQLGRDIERLPGAGAAGGLAAGAVAFLDAHLVSGIEAIMSQTWLREAVADADWVLTGEGCFDEQSLRGKVVSGVTRVAREAGARVGVLAGQVRLAPEVYRRAGIEAAVACREPGMELDYAMTHGATLLEAAARRFVREHICQKETSS
jgi:glycerate kinase